MEKIKCCIFDVASTLVNFKLIKKISCLLFEAGTGTEYLFNVANGTTIYVTVADGQAEFTQVVR